VLHIMFPSTPRLKGSHTLQCLMWNYVLNVRNTVDSFCPILRCKGACVDHAPSRLFQGPIFPLYNIILLRCIGDSMLNIYPFKSEKLFKTMVHILSSIICVENFDALPRLFLNMSLELLESIKSFSFLLNPLS
jgi:hypothetical protein